MGMNTYAGFVIRISQDQIMGINHTVRIAYTELLRSFAPVVVDNEDEVEVDEREDLDLDDLALALREGYESEHQEFEEEHPEIIKAYENFVEVFKQETGLTIYLFDLQSDMEANGDLEPGANWVLEHSECYKPSREFEALQKFQGSCYMEFFTTCG